ncbi:MAG: hypothetical protein HQK83_09070 [Fibrobacteria bacterium]|nr:hypothetical protein [Fibrobacteria bacterium]
MLRKLVMTAVCLTVTGFMTGCLIGNNDTTATAVEEEGQATQQVYSKTSQIEEIGDCTTEAVKQLKLNCRTDKDLLRLLELVKKAIDDEKFTQAEALIQTLIKKIESLITKEKFDDCFDPALLDKALELLAIINPPPNVAPVITAPAAMDAIAGNTVTFQLMVSDENGDSIGISLENIPEGASLDGETFSWSTNEAQVGTYQLVFIATDNGSPALSTSALVTITVAAPPALPGLVLYWDFEDVGEIVSDQSGNNNNGLKLGSGGVVPGVTGNGLDCNGQTAVVVPTADLGLTDFTFSAWVYSTEIRRMPIFEFAQPGARAGAHMWVHTTGYSSNIDGTVQVNLGMRNGQWQYFYSPSNAAPSMSWKMVTMTFNSETGMVIIYVDGSQVASKSFGTSALMVIHEQLYLGWRPDYSPEGSSNTYFKGVMDEVKIYDRVLSSEEVAGASAE